MKLPKFNFNDSYPLTLGVSDDYFTLSTRLKRLGHTPMQPRRRAAWLLSGALLVSFAAVVPLRLTARAQTERKAVSLSGTVRDQNGDAVANATVYLSLRNRAEPLETTDTGADGRFTFTSAIGENRLVEVWVDAGGRGLGQAPVVQDKSGVRSSNPIIARRAQVNLLLVAPDGTRAANLRLSVGRVGPEPDEQWIVPRPIAQKLQTQTNARGEAVFAGLPAGLIAQFWLSDQKFYPTPGAFGDLRGGQYAPISASDAVEVGKAKGWKTIRVRAPIALRGRVTTPAGNPKSGALVLARRIGADTERSFGTEIIAQARAGADGAYAMDGLQPGFYRIEVASEDWLTQDYVSPVEGRALKSPENRVDLALSRGGLIRGVLRSKGSKSPLVGQAVSLLDGQRNYQQTITNERGVFRFRANTKGLALVWISGVSGQRAGLKLPSSVFDNKWGLLNTELNVYEDTTKGGFHLASTSVFKQMMMAPWTPDAPGRDYEPRSFSEFNAPNAVMLPVKAGVTRDIIIESAIKPAVVTATLKGLITLPNGKGVSAIVTVRPALDNGDSTTIEEKTNARGRYSTTGLKPGRYKIIAYLDDETKANWAAPKITQTVKAGDNRADIKLSRGALLEGKVVSKASKKPIKGVEVLTADLDGDGIIEKTDAHGKFQFRVAQGRIAVRLHQHPENVTIHVYDRGATPRSFILSQNAPFMFNLKDGDTRRMQFESPQTSSKPANAATATKTASAQAITGTVVGTNGKPVAGAEVAGPALEFGEKGWNSLLVTDANGRFRLAERRANLFARKGDLTTARGTSALLGDDVTLKIEPKVYSRVEGQITDRTSGRPLMGAKVWYSATRQMDYPRQVKTMPTNAQGHFHFDKLRPFQPHYFTVTKNGYGRESVGTLVLQKGATKRAPVALKPLDKTLSGRIALANGKAVGAGFLVLAGTSNPRDDNQKTKTRADGSFAFANVPDEKLQISVVPPEKGKYWDGFWTRAGRSDVTIGLTKTRLHQNNRVGAPIH